MSAMRLATDKAIRSPTLNRPFLLNVNLTDLKYPIVQLSLDLTSLDEAIETAAIGVEAGVDWLEAGTPLLLAEGLHAVEGLRARFPESSNRRRPENDGRRLPRGRDDGEGGRRSSSS